MITTRSPLKVYENNTYHNAWKRHAKRLQQFFKTSGLLNIDELNFR